MKRYRNPDIFEPLAMSYVVGTLKGKARLRFDKLMEKHLYLREVTAAYQQKSAPLLGLLPPQQPSARIWKNIYKEIKSQKNQHEKTWSLNLKNYLPWSIAAFSSLTAVVMTVLFLNVEHQPSAYMSLMTSTEHANKMVVAVVKETPMEISFDMPRKTLPPDENMIPTFWLIPKNNDLPIRVGTLVRGGKYRMPINKTLWKQLDNTSTFAISMEPLNSSQTTTPSGEIIFTGDMISL
ncbi:hypothetical protein HMY34_05630 [Thiothrix subterranea]|uniref:anti-sigma factor n=1 Tax=Thiothrix subterranea TaxID=2735563 RepID=UPI00192A8F91|nr:anti-sigma factor [Thiothrix subterranea]QQZ28278.1 hypothetical protein HMY34_05630 [Thiothrix subterranea]